MEQKELNWPDPLKRLVAEATGDGLAVGLRLWLQQNKVATKPTSKSKNPFDDLMLLITAEYDRNQKGYPFEEQSLKAEIDAVVSEYSPAIEMLFAEGNFSETKRLVVVITCGQFLEFLNPKKDKFLQLVERVRKEGVAEFQTQTKHPHE